MILSKQTWHAINIINKLQNDGPSSYKKLNSDVTGDSYTLLKSLVEGGIIGAARGKNGGYFLLREIDKLSVKEINDVVEDKPSLELSSMAKNLNQYLSGRLSKITVDQLLDDHN